MASSEDKPLLTHDDYYNAWCETEDYKQWRKQRRHQHEDREASPHNGAGITWN